MNAYRDNGLLPEGLRDDLPPQAGVEAAAVERLMACFDAYGYDRVKPPLVEFEDTLLTGPGAAVATHMFRLMDPVSQRMMGVRPDMTLQVARMAATRLANAPRPMRLCYAGQALRVRGTQLRPEREVGQVGAELVGTSAGAADAEVIALAAEALLGVGIERLSIDLAIPNLVPTIAAELLVDETTVGALRAALGRKDAAALAALGDKVPPVFAELLLAAGPARETLAKLERLPLPAFARTIMNEVGQVIDRVEAARPGLSLTLDPAECHGFEYHTGLSFTLFVRGVRGELGRGGRYRLESGEAATGFTIYTDSLMRALPATPPRRAVYLPPGTPPEAAARLRAEGWRTVQALAADKAPQDSARAFGCTHILEGAAPRPVAASAKDPA